VTAVSFPPASAEPAPARLVVSCSHCGSELPLDALTDALLSALHAAPVPDSRTPPPGLSGDRAAALSPRQQEIVELVGEGSRVSSIATRLGIKVDTVRKHLHAVYAALGVHSQAELVEWVRGEGREGVPHLRAVATPAGQRERNAE
jgi:DNA-binding NarL/FixJ family response regulator